MSYTEIDVAVSDVDLTEYFLASRAGYEPQWRRDQRINVLCNEVHMAMDWLPIADMSRGGPGMIESFLADLRLALHYTLELAPGDAATFPNKAFGGRRPGSKESFARQPGA